MLFNLFYFIFYYIYIIIKMPAKPKTAFMPKGYEMNNKLTAEMKE